jgi:isoamylase
MRSFLATLAFSQGVPMLAHGDEMARTQLGNNNAYAQDNEITWVNWELDSRQQALSAFTRKLWAIRQAHPVLRRRHFFTGIPVSGSAQKDVMWFHPDGKEFSDVDWRDAGARVLGMLIDGAATDDVDEHGDEIRGDTLLLVLNGGDAPVPFTLPVLDGENIWVTMLDSANDELPAGSGPVVIVEAHALMLLRHGADTRVPAPEVAQRDARSVVAQHTL